MFIVKINDNRLVLYIKVVEKIKENKLNPIDPFKGQPVENCYGTSTMSSVGKLNALVRVTMDFGISISQLILNLKSIV